GGFRLHQQSNTILQRRYGISGEWPANPSTGAINVDAALKLTARETVRMCNSAAAFLPRERLGCALNAQAGYVNPENPGYLGETGYNSGTPTLRLLTEVLALDTEDRVNIFSVAPYGNNLAISSLPSPESFVSTWLIYAQASKLKMTYHANAIAHHNAVRASMDPPRAPYQYAAYEWN